MTSSRRSWNAAVSGPLSALLLVLSVAAPLLERADITHETVVESEHDPGSCPTPHDHTVCSQVSANHSASGAAQSWLYGFLRTHIQLNHGVERGISSAWFFQAPARAPPSI